ncbi:type II secretion system protein GspK [Pulveribacter sp.]|uniref:type II secretion system protein GspK n=1 Tax=Pulveribacter sp. TaxID=2678893 RepID=UPI0028AECC0E|nr:type II secretion system protein GspK [Pulveribacter sp.]
MHSIRAETRAVAAQRRVAEMEAIGEAAISLALQQMVSTQEGARRPWLRFQTSFDGHDVTVEINALNGFVDLNRASPELLGSLFSLAGGLSPQAAGPLAQSAVQTREKADTAGRAQGFEAAEDLMRVPGFDYDLYARLRPLVTADVRGSGRVNPQAAPQQVLVVLAEGDAARAAAIASARAAGGVGIDTTALRGEFIDSAVGSRFRLQAFIPMVDGSEAVVVRDVDVLADQRAGLPWRIFYGETRTHMMSAKDA